MQPSRYCTAHHCECFYRALEGGNWNSVHPFLNDLRTLSKQRRALRRTNLLISKRRVRWRRRQPRTEPKSFEEIASHIDRTKSKTSWEQKSKRAVLILLAILVRAAGGSWELATAQARTRAQTSNGGRYMDTETYSRCGKGKRYIHKLIKMAPAF